MAARDRGRHRRRSRCWPSTGIRFTILAPHQAGACARPAARRLAGRRAAARIDPTRPYRVTLPSGRTIALFFYDGPISQRRRLRAAAAHAARTSPRRLLGGFSRRRATGRSSSTSPPTARPTATITASATWRSPTRCDHIETQRLGARSPTTASSWSGTRRRTRSRSSRTPPGAARTASSAGAATAAATRAAAGLEPGVARARCATRSTGCATSSRRRFEQQAAALLRDPWAARDDYIDVVLDRSPESRRALPRRARAQRPLAPAERACAR